VVLAATHDWVETFLGRTHPQLGRPGPVCPFVPRALEMGTVWMRVEHVESPRIECIETAVRGYAKLFHTLPPLTGDTALLKAVLLIFPDIEQPELIDRAQESLKPLFIREGLMIGEFHATNDTPGLHNRNFRPLRSPYPMLAIRQLVSTDLPFLVRESDSVEVRIDFLTSYLERMEHRAKSKEFEQAKAALEDLLPRESTGDGTR
jgi:hypothetical protein